MTDKVQKIRKGIERLKSQLIKGACASQIAMETRCKEEAYNEVLAILDSLQGEPVSEELEEAADSYIRTHGEILGFGRQTFKAGAKWQEKKDQEKSIDYDKLNTMLEDSLSKETKESWNERLGQGRESAVTDADEVLEGLIIGFNLACGNGDRTIGECLEEYKPKIIDAVKKYLKAKILEIQDGLVNEQGKIDGIGNTCAFNVLNEVESIIETMQPSHVSHEPKFKPGNTVYYKSFGITKSMVVSNVVDNGDGNPMYEDSDGNSVLESDLINLSCFGLEDVSCDELCKLVEEYCQDCRMIYDGVPDFAQDLSLYVANWQKKKDKKWLSDNHKQIYNNGYEEGFESGRDDAYNEIMKDAVHGNVDYPFIGYDFPNIYPNYKELKDYCDRHKIKDGNKVKLIIIKED